MDSSNISQTENNNNIGVTISISDDLTNMNSRNREKSAEHLLENIENIRNRATCMIEELLMKYKQDDFFLSKLTCHLNSLEHTILQQKREYQQRKLRKQELEFDKKNFIEKFFQNNNYLYFPESEIFIEYDGINYNIVSEDSIWSKVLSQVHQERTLIPWKQKVRIEILSMIKKQNISSHVPESETIQRIFDILKSTISTSKEHVKFILCYIGDLILKKPCDTYTILANPRLTTFFGELNYFINKFLKVNVLQNIKFKYYNHSYGSIYLLDSLKNADKKFLWIDLIKKHILDIIMISIYYSERFESLDNYIQTFCSNEEFLNFCNYVRKNKRENIIQNFSEKSFIYSSSLNMTPEEVVFVWKDYLEERDMPNIMFHKDVIDTLKQQIYYDASLNIFKNITSEKLHYINLFCEFFKKSFSNNPEQNEVFEIDEIVILFKEFHKLNIDNEKVIKILKHFFKDIEVNQNKFVEVSCDIINKKQLVNNFLNETLSDKTKQNYNDYVKYSKKNKICITVNKQYFEECKEIF